MMVGKEPDDSADPEHGGAVATARAATRTGPRRRRVPILEDGAAAAQLMHLQTARRRVHHPEYTYPPRRRRVSDTRCGELWSRRSVGSELAGEGVDVAPLIPPPPACALRLRVMRPSPAAAAARGVRASTPVSKALATTR
eukprot:CAMPEP_0170142502 /NCGR_PEP_ID=MMETSP0033_2-20121228/7672_1 /TAXON_ID=195969 /ORGANISM="Dolichomastix tenuilepis, Strain CCMP3274" /LENGTH=139 /DNA_ID=CAMNT_0010378835 /DNA_START=281 /DNA_END=698 /DNA_ORIENTATION=-